MNQTFLPAMCRAVAMQSRRKSTAKSWIYKIKCSKLLIKANKHVWEDILSLII